MVRRMLLATVVLLVACVAVFVARRTNTRPAVAGSPRPDANAAKRTGASLKERPVEESRPRPLAVLTHRGLYESDTRTLVALEKVSGGVIGVGSTQKHLETTDVIPARTGVSFGFEFEWHNLPAGRPLRYRSVMHHPPLRQPDHTVLEESVVTREAKSEEELPTSEVWSFLPGF